MSWRSAPLLGLLAMAGAGVLLVIPTTKHYSSDGFTRDGAVDVRCGNAFDSKSDMNFADPLEQQFTTERDPIFEGKSAVDVCKTADKKTRRNGLLLAGAGLAWLVIGGIVRSNRRKPVLTAQPSTPKAPIEAVPMQPVPEAESNPQRWAADPFGRHEMRYWNGNKWTEHVSDGGLASVDEPTANPAPAMAAHLDRPPLPDPFTERPTDSPHPVVAAEDLSKPSVLKFDNGTTVTLMAPLVIGRGPSPITRLPGAGLLPYADPTMSVSATHLAVGPDVKGVWVEDTGSTNGSAVIDPNGNRSELQPGVRVVVGPGFEIQFGERSIRVVRGE